MIRKLTASYAENPFWHVLFLMREIILFMYNCLLSVHGNCGEKETI
jgi:hypothetical protein